MLWLNSSSAAVPITPTHLHSHLPLLPHTQATQAKSKESASHADNSADLTLHNLGRKKERTHNTGDRCTTSPQSTQIL